MGTEYPTIAAHKHSSGHRAEVMASAKCGCFFCLSVYPPSTILEWIDGDQTALCPNCGIDSVVGEKSGFPVANQEFLEAMNKHWFS